MQARHRARARGAARRSFDQRGRDRARAERALLVGDDRHHRRHRVVAGGARLLGGEPGPRPQQQLVVRQVGGLPARRVRRHPHVDQRGVVAPELIAREPGRFELRAPAGRRPPRRRWLRALRPTRRARHHVLGAVGVAPERRIVVVPLDARHLGAVLPEVHGRERARRSHRQVEHADVRERAGHT